MSAIRGILVFEWGEIDAPPDIQRFMQTCRRRRDGQPDRRFKEGKIWWSWFRSWNATPKGIDRRPVNWWKTGASSGA